MLALLVQHGKTTGRDYTRALVNSQVVPSYDDVSLPAVVEYRALMEKHKPAVPRGAARRQVRAAALQLHQPRGLRQRPGDRGGAAARGADIRRAPPSAQALESLRNFDLGIGAPLTLRPRAAPGAGQRLLHPRRERPLGARRRLDRRGEGVSDGGRRCRRWRRASDGGGCAVATRRRAAEAVRRGLPGRFGLLPRSSSSCPHPVPVAA